MDVNSKESDITPTPNNNNHVSSSQWSLNNIHLLVGVRLEPKKRRHADTRTWRWASMLLFPQRRPAGASSSSLQAAGQSSLSTPSEGQEG
jgi:hypothetical protein